MRSISVLGPTLFSLYVNDLPKAITGAATLLFVIDTTIYAIGKDVASIAEALTSGLQLASEWLCDNHLNLNVHKTKTMLIHSAWRANLPLSIHLLTTPVQQVHTTKFCHAKSSPGQNRSPGSLLATKSGPVANFISLNGPTQDHVWQPNIVIAICLHGYYTELQSTGLLVRLK